jgi:hypothetical protein
MFRVEGLWSRIGPKSNNIVTYLFSINYKLLLCGTEYEAWKENWKIHMESGRCWFSTGLYPSRGQLTGFPNLPGTRPEQSEGK